ncbi:MAG: GNAT family N-acetyltransferase [Chloroflexi bacterium]|nr:GNAT family N-acetyltransferase [Chloroflexota bacterium]
MWTIRAVLPSDRAAVLTILANTGVFDANEMRVAEEVLDCYLRDGEQGGYFCYLLLRGEEPLGYICFGPTPLTYGTWDVYWMAVRPSAQRTGAGKELVSFAEGVIRESQGRLSLIETSSRPAYEAARLFYLSIGYEVECVVEGFYAPEDSKVLFAKRFHQQG